MNNRVNSLLSKLISYDNTTPASGDIFNYIIGILNQYSFSCNYFIENGVGNLIAKLPSNQIGGTLKSFAFAGHLDTVVIINKSLWKYDPFVATNDCGKIYGRGTSDMKGSIASFIVALQDFLITKQNHGDIYLLLTGDEEGDCLYGTASIVKKLRENNTTIDLCLIGEPTSNQVFGDTIKHGRRGSINFIVNIIGKQCHIAYPERGINPSYITGKLINDLNSIEFIKDEIKDTTNLEIFSIKTSSSVSNIIPMNVSISFNVRFSHNYNSNNIIDLVKSVIKKYDDDFTTEEINHLDNHITKQDNKSSKLAINLQYQVSGESLITQDMSMADIIKNAIITSGQNQSPKYEMSGGTSDARFLQDICKSFAEFGPKNITIHQIDEHIEVEELNQLYSIYLKILTSLSTHSNLNCNFN